MRKTLSSIIISTFFLSSILAFASEITDSEFQEKMQKALEHRRIEAEMKSRNSQLFEIDADSSHSWDAVHYNIIMEFFPPSSTIEATTTITGTVEETSLDSVDMHFAPGYSITGVQAGGISTGYTWNNHDLMVALDRIYNPGEEFEISISYNGNAPLIYGPNAIVGMGIYWGNEIYTYTDPEGARGWYPCYDKPYDKATYSAEYTVPQGWIMASNGELVSTVTNPNNTVTTTWNHDYQIETYLISVACSNYATFDTTWNGIPFNYYVYPGHLNNAMADFEDIPGMMECYIDYYGDYAFEGYGQAEASLFGGGGAMEHQTMTTLGDACINGFGSYEFLYAHELSHMWWGDAVSLVEWDHMWLNEGFATYSECVYAEWKYGWNYFLSYAFNNMQNIYLGWESTNNRHPIVPPPPGYLFSTVIYEKGGSVLHMLRYIMGDEAFFACLQDYYDTYLYGFVNTDDFQEKCENFYGGNLDWFFDQWIYGEGYPIFEYFYSCEEVNPGDYDIQFVVSQTQEEILPDFQTFIDIGIFSGGDWVDTLQVWIDDRNANISFDYTGAEPDSLVLDPDRWILCRKTYLEDISDPILVMDDYEWSTEFLYQNTTADLVITLENQGMPVTNLQGTLSTDDSNLNIPNNLVSFGDIGFLETGSNSSSPIPVSLDASAGSYWAVFELHLEAAGLDSTIEIKIPVGEPEILLVDDDGSGNKDTVATNALNEIEAVYKYWDVFAMGEPNNLNDYPAVFWNTGHTENPLTTNEISLLCNYLGTNGNLFITGTNLASDLYGDPFLIDFLRMGYDEEVSLSMVNGVDSDPISDGMQLFLYSDPSDQDAVDVLEGGTGFLVYYGGGPCGVRYEGIYRSVAVSFAFEDVRSNLPSMNTPSELDYAVFTWMDLELPVSEPPDSFVPSEFRIVGNFPNPFNPSTSIVYELPENAIVKLEIFNLTGQKIAVLVDGIQPTGHNRSTWNGKTGDGSNVASGLYFCRLDMKGLNSGKKLSAVSKMILLK